VQRTEDTVTGALSTTVIRQSVYPSAVFGPGQPLMSGFVAAADTFSGTHSIAGIALSGTPGSVVGTQRVYVDTISTDADGYVLAETGATGSAPHAISNGGSTGLSVAESFPGFTVQLLNSPAIETVIVTAPGDTIRPEVPTTNGLQQPESTLGVVRGFHRLRWLGDAYGPGAPFAWDLPVAMQAALDASIAARFSATLSTMDNAVRALPNFPTGAAGVRPLIIARIPFEIIGPDGSPAQAAMFQRHRPGDVLDSLEKNSRLFGTAGDTVRLTVPATAWMPGDTLYVIENIQVDLTARASNGSDAVVVHDTVINGRTQQLPVQVFEPQIGLRLVLGCESDVTPVRTTCNPIRQGEVGASSYLPMQPGWETVIHRRQEFDQNSDVLLTATPHLTAERRLDASDARSIHVVPNPYVVVSAYDALNANRTVSASRVMFVNVPLEGVLRVYSVSGQLMRQLTWTAADLAANGGTTTHGDLPFDLRRTSGSDIGPGLYLYVLTGRSANSAGVTARGKFVVIR
jgi:hypothetical protein